jgi:hypothetical protein
MLDRVGDHVAVFLLLYNLLSARPALLAPFPRVVVLVLPLLLHAPALLFLRFLRSIKMRWGGREEGWVGGGRRVTAGGSAFLKFDFLREWELGLGRDGVVINIVVLSQ